MSRDTSTGSAYEAIVAECIRRSCQKFHLEANRQVVVGQKPGGGRHIIDWEIVSQADENIRGLVSCKTQNTGGTAEEKIAYEVIKLLHAMQTDTRYVKAWVIMGGDGWSSGMRVFINNHLQDWIPDMRGKIIFLTTDQLISREVSL